MVVAGKVEEPEQVAVADVKEEVIRAGVVAVLDQFHQREAEEPLIEADGLLGVLADQREVVNALDRGLRPIRRGPQVAAPQFFPAGPDLLEFPALWLWHVCLLARR